MACADLNFRDGGEGSVLEAFGSWPIPGVIICRAADEGVLFASHLIHIYEEVNKVNSSLCCAGSELKRKGAEPPLLLHLLLKLAQWMSGGPCKCG